MKPHDDDRCACRKDEAMQMMDGYLRAAIEGKDAFEAYVDENADADFDHENYYSHGRIIHGAALVVFIDDEGRSTATMQEYKAGLPVGE